MLPILLRSGSWLALLALLGGAVAGGCSESSADAGADAAAGKLRVAVTIPPQRLFVERIGGDRVVVQVLVSPDDNPHFYEPTSRQIAELEQAQIYFMVGEPFEQALLPRIRAVNDRLRAVDTTTAVTAAAGRDAAHEAHTHGDHDHGHGHAHEYEHEHADTHTWVSPRLVAEQARLIARTLAELDPEHEEEYRANLAAFLTEIDALDREIRETLAEVEGGTFLVYHAAWSYFARDYGLTQLAIEIGGLEPNTADFIRTVETARKHRVRTIFIQPQHSPRAAETIAREIDATVHVIDPLAADWADNLRRVARALADGMRGSTSRR